MKRFALILACAALAGVAGTRYPTATVRVQVAPVAASSTSFPLYPANLLEHYKFESAQNWSNGWHKGWQANGIALTQSVSASRGTWDAGNNGQVWFDGADDVYAYDNAAFYEHNAFSNFTFNIWMNPTNTRATGETIWNYDNIGAEATRQYFEVSITALRYVPLFSIIVDPQTTGLFGANNTAMPTNVPFLWSFTGAAVTGSQVWCAYTNGIRYYCATSFTGWALSYTNLASANRHRIGVYASDYYRGYMSEFQLYNITFASNECLQVFQHGSE
jgi:hypothetical protein